MPVYESDQYDQGLDIPILDFPEFIEMRGTVDSGGPNQLDSNSGGDIQFQMSEHYNDKDEKTKVDNHPPNPPVIRRVYLTLLKNPKH